MRVTDLVRDNDAAIETRVQVLASAIAAESGAPQPDYALIDCLHQQIVDMRTVQGNFRQFLLGAASLAPAATERGRQLSRLSLLTSLRAGKEACALSLTGAAAAVPRIPNLRLCSWPQVACRATRRMPRRTAAGAGDPARRRALPSRLLPPPAPPASPSVTKCASMILLIEAMQLVERRIRLVLLAWCVCVRH